jgi:hypothetical protein
MSYPLEISTWAHRHCRQISTWAHRHCRPARTRNPADLPSDVNLLSASRRQFPTSLPSNVLVSVSAVRLPHRLVAPPTVSSSLAYPPMRRVLQQAQPASLASAVIEQVSVLVIARQAC